MPIPYDTTVFNGKLYVKEEDLIRICEQFHADHNEFRAMVKKEYDELYAKKNDAEYDQLDDVDWEIVAISMFNQPEDEPDKRENEAKPQDPIKKVKKENPKAEKVKIKKPRDPPKAEKKVKKENPKTYDPDKVKKKKPQDPNKEVKKKKERI